MSADAPSRPPVAEARTWLAAAERDGIVPSQGPLVVACSGGLDSVVLLHLLLAAGVERARLHVVHVDHRMRPDSATDAAWVHELCEAWGVPCRIVTLAGDPPPASEDAARAARWAALDEVANELGSDAILTAHHRDDQAETVLHHALRGSGLRGLTGMRPVSGRRRRPLLGWSRADLQRYAESLGLEWREDATNRDLTFTRNRLRHEVLPLLQRVVPGATGALERLSRHALDAQLALDEAVDGLLDRLVGGAAHGAPAQHAPAPQAPAQRAPTEQASGAHDERARRSAEIRLDRAGLLALGGPLRRQVLRAAARRVGVRIDRRGTALADDFTRTGSRGGQVHLTGGLVLRRDGERLVFLAPPPPAERQG